MLGWLFIDLYNETVQTGYMNASHPSSLHHYSKSQHQLDKLTNERKLIIANIIKPFPIMYIKLCYKTTVVCPIWLTWVPILKFQFSSAACVNPWTTFCIDTNPSPFRPSKDINRFSKDLVIGIFGVGFKKSSCCESIHCCSFTELLCISIIFIVRIEAQAS